MSEGLDLRTCENCKEVFVYSHDYYKPKSKMVPVENDIPKILVYCCDACFEGVPRDTKGSCGHEMKGYVMTDGKAGRLWLCRICWMLMGVEKVKS